MLEHEMMHLHLLLKNNSFFFKHLQRLFRHDQLEPHLLIPWSCSIESAIASSRRLTSLSFVTSSSDMIFSSRKVNWLRVYTYLRKPCFVPTLKIPPSIGWAIIAFSFANSARPLSTRGMETLTASPAWAGLKRCFELSFIFLACFSFSIFYSLCSVWILRFLLHYYISNRAQAHQHCHSLNRG